MRIQSLSLDKDEQDHFDYEFNVFDLTENCSDTLNLGMYNNLKKLESISEKDLTEKEKQNLAKLLRTP